MNFIVSPFQATGLSLHKFYLQSVSSLWDVLAYGMTSLTLLFFSLFQVTGMSSLKFYFSSPFLPMGRTGFNLLFGPF